MKHMIGKQIIELQLSRDQEASSMQNKFSQMYWQEMIPAMEALFNDLTTEEELIQIDRLEIDLGILSTNELQKDLLIPRLKKEIENWFQNNKGHQSKIQRSPLRKGIFEKWLFFLENGFLPWSMQDMPDNWQTAILETFRVNPVASQNVQILVSQNTYAQKRLIQQYEPEFLQQLIEIFSTKKQEALLSFVQSFPALEDVEEFWTFAVNQILVQQKKWDAKTLMTAWNKHQKTSRKSEKPTDQKQDLIKPSSSIETEEVYIENAGVILLHPFLQRLFDNLNLLDDKDFKSQESVSKAIHLLHYMATNTVEPAEHDLSLLKFICGVPLNVPIKKYIHLHEQEKEEADALLQAAIQHWSALGQVSNVSLQETFLQRAGKLHHEQSGWKLQIERKTVDILLNQLPWSISIVKLPWMHDLLKIDWM